MHGRLEITVVQEISLITKFPQVQKFQNLSRIFKYLALCHKLISNFVVNGLLCSVLVRNFCIIFLAVSAILL